MQIVIAGLGKVGNFLAGELSLEGHDLTVVDNRPERVRTTTSSFDVMGLTGNIVAPDTISAAGLDEADLFIAVTTNDEVNLLSCLLAKKAGCARAIARVRSPEYSDSMEYLQDQLGLEMIINPERLAAQEIERVLSLPGAIDVDTFAHGIGEIYKFKILPDSILDGMKVKNVPSKVGDKVLLCVDERNHLAYIPDGDFVLHGKDKLYLAGSRANVVDFFAKAGLPTSPTRRVMIIGAAKIAHYLVEDLMKEGTEVTIIDHDLATCERFALLHPGCIIIHGDGADADLLLEEGLLEMDALVSLTGFDEENVFLSMFAHRKAGLKTITKANRMFDEVIQDLDLDTLINPKKLTAEFIIRHVRSIANSSGSNVETMHKLANDQVEAIEFNVCENSPVIGQPLYQMNLKPGVLIALITRGEDSILPGGSDQMLAGDSVVVITNNLGFTDLSDILAAAPAHSPQSLGKGRRAKP
ncbi:Trk system potassium transporter TrkA [Erysipelotrichaceae bacterium RD49]|nr:Trk system potassium transporter TrkA [Erysipelotrichaceae bacterium RD49]